MRRQALLPAGEELPLKRLGACTDWVDGVCVPGYKMGWLGCTVLMQVRHICNRGGADHKGLTVRPIPVILNAHGVASTGPGRTLNADTIDP